MARARDAVQAETPLYERDFCLWVEEQVRLLKEGRLHQLDVVNLIDEIEDLGIHEKKAVRATWWWSSSISCSTSSATPPVA